jgi:hypothetical protein
MKKTLLLTTALIGNLLIGSVQAQTTITGELKMAYKSVEGFTAGAASNSGFTSERQINFLNKGKLNNGLDYAAGFSLEMDGNDDGSGSNIAIDGKEGNYFNIISGNTTVTLGMDHILNGDYAIVPRVGAPMNEEIGVIGGTAVVRTDSAAGLQYSQSLGDNNESMGLGVIQTIPSFGRIAVNFVPRSDDTAQTADTAVPVTANGKSAYSIFFVGDLGVKGLQVALERAQNEKNGTATDPKVTAFGASYTMGDFSVGAERQKFVDGSKAETETTEFGLTYKINNNASVGIGKIVTEGTTSAGAAKAGGDEEITYLQIGYNLGGFATQLSYIDAENVGYTAANDAQAFVAKIIAKF